MTRFRPVLLSGGLGSRMGALADFLPKALLPFGARCRLMDGSLHAAKSAGADEAVVLLQHRADAIMAHAQRAWAPLGLSLDFCGRDLHSADTFERELGTAHALWLNRHAILRTAPRDVIVLHSDHIYQQDLTDYYRFHVETNAALTFSATNVDLRHVPLFGMLELDDQRNVVGFIEKPENPTRTSISAGVWIFRADTLFENLEALIEDGRGYDISKDLIPRIRAAGHTVKAFPFDGYWEDIGTPERYWTAHVKLLTHPDYRSLVQALPLTLPSKNAGQLTHSPNGSVRHSVLSDADYRHEAVSYSVISNCYVGMGKRADALVAYDCDRAPSTGDLRTGLYFRNQEIFRPTEASIADAGLVHS